MHVQSLSRLSWPSCDGSGDADDDGDNDDVACKMVMIRMIIDCPTLEVSYNVLGRFVLGKAAATE